MSSMRSYMLRVCAEHKAKLGYGDAGQRLCPEGCVDPLAEHIVVVPLKDVTALLRSRGRGPEGTGSNYEGLIYDEAAAFIEEAERSDAS